MRFKLLIFLLILFKASLLAAETGNLDFSASFLYPNITLNVNEKLNFDFIIKNNSKKDAQFEVLVLEKPEDWKAEISSSKYLLSSLFLEAEEKSVLSFSASTGSNVLPVGNFEFKLKIKNILNKTEKTATLNVNIVEQEVKRNFLILKSHYPQITALNNSEISFSLEIYNSHHEDVLVNLEADLPLNWEYSFSPLYAAERQVSSIVLAKGVGLPLIFKVIPFQKAEVGPYNIKVKAIALGEEVEEKLEINLLGQEDISAAPVNGLLSAVTEVKKTVSIPIEVINKGTVAKQNVRFLAVKVSNWDVKFKPEKLEILEANMEEPRLVEMLVTPSADSLMGDYGLGFALRGEDGQDYSPLDFRITVTASTAWAWLGGLMIVLVILGLALTFRKFGRR